ncbi:MAG: prepilin peptidase [Candidatus Pacebacteria bacterium]|nr:prepilin peptidase [Candidatus Paceibacterota bacterium]
MENYILQIGIFIFGTIIGSFLNVVILRQGQKSLNGRSECQNCHKKLEWYELIPILSFFIQKGKCSECKTNISWQYPLVETATGLLFLFTFNQLFALCLFDLISLWLIFSLLLIIFVYDLYHKIIPDTWVFLFSGLALLRIFYSCLPAGRLDFQGFGFLSTFWAGPFLALPFVILWIISKGEWLGLGDAKLALGIGWFLGLSQGFSAIILGVWIGAFIGLLLIFLSKLSQYKQLFFLSKNFTIKSELPFAPFLIIGIILVFFFDISIWNLF